LNKANTKNTSIKCAYAQNQKTTSNAKHYKNNNIDTTQYQTNILTI